MIPKPVNDSINKSNSDNNKGPLLTWSGVVALQANRWKKRGLSMVPTKFGIYWENSPFNVFMTIYHADGTIAIEHGGIEVGQGVNTKVRSTCLVAAGSGGHGFVLYCVCTADAWPSN